MLRILQLASERAGAQESIRGSVPGDCAGIHHWLLRNDRERDFLCCFRAEIEAGWRE
jgi:hypothetical protein